MSIQLSETVGIDNDNAHGNNVSNVDNSSDNTKYSVKMPWLCMLCKMCDVRVSIGLVVFVAVAFIAIIIVRRNLTMHRSVTPFIIWQPIQRPRQLERVYKPMHTSH